MSYPMCPSTLMSAASSKDTGVLVPTVFGLLAFDCFDRFWVIVSYEGNRVKTNKRTSNRCLSFGPRQPHARTQMTGVITVHSSLFECCASWTSRSRRVAPQSRLFPSTNRKSAPKDSPLRRCLWQRPRIRKWLQSIIRCYSYLLSQNQNGRCLVCEMRDGW